MVVCFRAFQCPDSWHFRDLLDCRCSFMLLFDTQHDIYNIVIFSLLFSIVLNVKKYEHLRF